MRVRVGELLLFRSPVAPEEVRFALWTPHKSGDCWAERNTPTWSLSAGLPKQFHVTDQTDAHYRGNGPPQDTDARVCGGKFLLVVVWQPTAEQFTLSVENNGLLYFFDDNNLNLNQIAMKLNYGHFCSFLS